MCEFSEIICNLRQLKSKNKIQIPMQLDYLDEISGGDEQFKKDLIVIFLKQMPEFIENMKKFMDENDMDNLAKEAHTAKSSVLIFGMESTGKYLKEVQTLAESGSIKSIPNLLKIIEEEIIESSKQLRLL